MVDQLTLALDIALPGHPPAIRPMLARPATAPFDSPDHLFAPSWGGRRALAIIGPSETPGTGAVRFIDEDGEPIEPTPPELAGLAARVIARSAILDGELVVVDQSGRLDAAGLAARLDAAGLAARLEPAGMAARLDPAPPTSDPGAEHGPLASTPARPAAYLVFDLLYLDGRPLLALPLERRREALRRVLRPGDEVVAVPAIPGDGVALHAAVSAQGLAGIVARVRRSPYLPGVRSRLWRFIPASVERAEDVTEPTLGLEDAAVDPAQSGRPVAAPVLALIRRLPLDWGEAET